MRGLSIYDAYQSMIDTWGSTLLAYILVVNSINAEVSCCQLCKFGIGGMWLRF